MILKELAKPIHIHKLEALVTRTFTEHPKLPDIRQRLVKQLSGFKGEKAATYYMDHLSNKGYVILHNLRLPSGKYHFQIDYLLLTQCFAMILECKNYYGTVYFDENFQQLIRNANDQDEGFPDPLAQARWHQRQLQDWLRLHHFPSYPIEYLVVFANSSTILKANPRNREVLKRVVHSQLIVERVEELGSMYNKECFDDKNLRKLGKSLLKSDVPEDGDILDRFGLVPSDIRTGVQCPECAAFGMIRIHGTWFCPKCGEKSKDAHVKAVRDYFLLIDKTINNRQFRDFTGLSSDDIAKKLLGSMKLPFSGTNKGRIYYKPENNTFFS